MMKAKAQAILLAIIVLTFCSSCSTPLSYNPLKGWKSDGDSGNLFGGSQAYVEKFPFDKAILDNVQDFIKKLPIRKDPFGFGDRPYSYFIDSIAYFEDGTGQRAVKIEIYLSHGLGFTYILIYNNSDVRTKVIKLKYTSSWGT